MQPATAREASGLSGGGRFSLVVEALEGGEYVKARWLVVATLAALLVGMLAVAGMAAGPARGAANLPPGFTDSQ
ncbi:MAG TPA: hypothetical protein VF206_02590, partial [Rubrobacter sp.]